MTSGLAAPGLLLDPGGCRWFREGGRRQVGAAFPRCRPVAAGGA